MNHVHVGMACQEATIMLNKKQNETILKWQSIKTLKSFENNWINIDHKFKMNNLKRNTLFWKVATGHVVQKTSLFNNVRQMTLETWKKNKCDKIQSLKTNWMIKRISIIPINDKIKTNSILPLFLTYQGKFPKKNDVKYLASSRENRGFSSSNKPR